MRPDQGRAVRARPVSVPLAFMYAALILEASDLVIHVQLSGQNGLDLSLRAKHMPETPSPTSAWNWANSRHGLCMVAPAMKPFDAGLVATWTMLLHALYVLVLTRLSPRQLVS